MFNSRACYARQSDLCAAIYLILAG